MDETNELDWFRYAVLAGFYALAGLVAYLIARVIRGAEGRDRRRYVLAALTVFGPPVVLAVVALCLDRLRVSGALALRSEWWFFGNMALAAAFSASAAFVIPFRGLRERGFAIVGGAVTGYAVYCMCILAGDR